jgi:Uma2 family endonuclease
MPATALVTSEQYLALPDEFDQSGNRIRDELIGGEIVKMPPASMLHDLIKNEIKSVLDDVLKQNKRLGLKALVEFGSRLTDHDTFVPDVCVVKRDRLDEVSRILQGAPDLAIEIVSPSDTVSHLKAKVDTYLANGSHSVWVVFPELKSVAIYKSGSIRELRADETIDDEMFPGLSLAVSSFFELS